MKYLICSDIHGSFEAAQKVIDYFEKAGCQKLLILGDTLYHGPRNPLPAGHNPMAVAELLNQYREKICACRGNCDAEVDQKVLKFPTMADYFEVSVRNPEEKLNDNIIEPKKISTTTDKTSRPALQDSLTDSTTAASDAASSGKNTLRLFCSHGHVYAPETPDGAMPVNCEDAKMPDFLSKEPVSAVISEKNGNTEKNTAFQNRTPTPAVKTIFFYGHTHISVLEKRNSNYIVCNPGSTSLPKGGTQAGFAVLDTEQHTLSLLDMNGNVISQLSEI